MNTPKISFITSHGNFLIENWSPTQSLATVCSHNGIPYQSVSLYSKDGLGDLKLIVDGQKPIRDVLNGEVEEVLIQSNRNLNYKGILLKDTLVDENNSASTEYVYNGDDNKNLIAIQYTPEQCKEVVEKRVEDFLNEATFTNSDKIIVGISGGGDSNTLLQALLASPRINKEQIVAVMCLGLPDWDSGKSRAIQICNESGVELNFVSSEEIAKILGKERSENWAEAFFEVFEDSDIDVLGTLIIRLSLQHQARLHGGTIMVTGLNLEDLLAESLLRTMQGKLPLPFPIRQIDEIRLWYPLYQVPKKILDGCHPKFSLENYSQRSSDKLINRAVPYYLSQMMGCILPGIEFDLINGFKKMSQLNKEGLYFDEDLGFSVLEPLSEELKGKWKYYTIC